MRLAPPPFKVRALRRLLLLILFSAIWAASIGCGGAAHVGSSPAVSPPSSSSPQSSQFGHVVLVVEENHSYNEVIGNGAMPYLNSLASNYALATQYFANLHPSIPNYFVLTTGQPITVDDAYTGTVSADNIVREMNAARKTWKAYAESLPQTGYLGGDVYPYAKHHNPFVYLSDVIQQTSQQANVVPFSQFAADLSSGHLPNFSFVVPNLLDDAHTGTLNEADVWLQRYIGPLVNDPAFQQDGLLIITFDEGNQADISYGGGQVATVLVSSKVKKKYRSTTLYQHQSTLRTILQVLGVSNYPGAAATAPAMNEFFQ